MIYKVSLQNRSHIYQVRYGCGVKREGTILPLIAIAMLALMGMAALAVDIGALALAKAQFQMAADAAAFAGARYLDRKSTRLNSSHRRLSRMPSSA